MGTDGMITSVDLESASYKTAESLHDVYLKDIGTL